LKNNLAPGESWTLARKTPSRSLDNFVRNNIDRLRRAHDSRQRAFGENTGNLIQDNRTASMVLSLHSASQQQANKKFISPPGFDLTQLLRQDHAILLAWVPDYGPTKQLNDFTVRRSSRNSLFRLAVPIQQD